MPSREWPLRIQDIMDSIDEILQRTANITFEAFIENQTIVKSVLYDLNPVVNDGVLLEKQAEMFLQKLSLDILIFLGVLWQE